MNLNDAINVIIQIDICYKHKIQQKNNKKIYQLSDTFYTNKPILSSIWSIIRLNHIFCSVRAKQRALYNTWHL